MCLVITRISEELGITLSGIFFHVNCNSVQSIIYEFKATKKSKGPFTHTLCCAARRVAVHYCALLSPATAVLCVAALCVAFRSTAACFSVMNIHNVEKNG